jgi:hypothetical protein
MSDISALAFIAAAEVAMGDSVSCSYIGGKATPITTSSLSEVISSAEETLQQAKLEALRGALGHINEAMGLAEIGSGSFDLDLQPSFRLIKQSICREIRFMTGG